MGLAQAQVKSPQTADRSAPAMRSRDQCQIDPLLLFPPDLFHRLSTHLGLTIH